MMNQENEELREGTAAGEAPGNPESHTEQEACPAEQTPVSQPQAAATAPETPAGGPVPMQAAAPNVPPYPAGEAAVKKSKKKVLIPAIAGIAVVAIGVFVFLLTGDLRAYLSAKSTLEAGEYEKAAAAFLELEDYKDSPELYQECIYQQSVMKVGQKDYDGALDLLGEIPDYPGAKEQMAICHYAFGEDAEKQNDYKKAIESFEQAGEYGDSQAKVQSNAYAYAKQCAVEYEYAEAAEYFEKAGDYEDSAKLAGRYAQFDTTRFIDGKFYYSPEELSEFCTAYLQEHYAGLSCSANKPSTSENGTIITFSKNGKSSKVGLMLGNIDSEEHSMDSISIICPKGQEDYELLAAGMVMLINLADWTLSHEEADEISQNLLDAKVVSSIYADQEIRNGIHYIFALLPSGDMVLSVQAEK